MTLFSFEQNELENNAPKKDYCSFYKYCLQDLIRVNQTPV